MSDQRHNSDGDVEELLRSRDWIGPLAPVKLDALARTARRRARGRLAAAVAAAAVVLVLGGVAASSTLLREASVTPQQPAASGNGIVPWVDTPASQPTTAAPASCQGGDVKVSLGRTGAWHGQAIQVIDVTNVSGQPCAFSASDFSATATTSQGHAVAVGTPGSQPAPVTLAANQTAHVALGAPASCGGSPEIARTVMVKVAGGAAQNLGNAWLPVNCGQPTVVQLNVDPRAAATDSAPVTATLNAPPSVQAGTTAQFTVTLTNTSASDAVTFANCPSYLIGLKVAQVSRTYQLNCDVNPNLAAGQSRTYAMQFDVPADASGSDQLTWQLVGYQAADTVPLQVN